MHIDRRLSVQSTWLLRFKLLPAFPFFGTFQRVKAPNCLLAALRSRHNPLVHSRLRKIRYRQVVFIGVRGKPCHSRISSHSIVNFKKIHRFLSCQFKNLLIIPSGIARGQSTGSSKTSLILSTNFLCPKGYICILKSNANPPLSIISLL